MRKNGALRDFSDLKLDVYIAIDALPVSLTGRDVLNGVKGAGWDVSYNTVVAACHELANDGDILFSVEEKGNWVYWSRNWNYGGGNL